jgi:hypothetical protein
VERKRLCGDEGGQGGKSSREMEERSGVERENPLGNHVYLSLGKKEEGNVLLKIKREAGAKLPREVVPARIGREKDRPKIFRWDLSPFTCAIEAVGSGVRVQLGARIRKIVCWLRWELRAAVGVKLVPGRKEIGWKEMCVVRMWRSDVGGSTQGRLVRERWVKDGRGRCDTLEGVLEKRETLLQGRGSARRRKSRDGRRREGKEWW